MAFSFQLQQIFLSPTTRFRSQQKSITNPLISLKLPSIHPLAFAQNAAVSNVDSTDVAAIDASAEEVLLPPELRRELMPNHVAVIMDGNRRWTKMRGFPIALGYEAGIRAVRNVIELCGNWGIRVLTLFAFSSDNWLRPKVEVDFLMGLFERALKDELENFASWLMLNCSFHIHIGLILEKLNFWRLCVPFNKDRGATADRAPSFMP